MNHDPHKARDGAKHAARSAFLAFFAFVSPVSGCSSDAIGEAPPSPGDPHGASPSDSSDRDAGAGSVDRDPWSVGPALGARRVAGGDLEVRVRAPSATRLELCLFTESFGASERVRLPMDRNGEVFSLRVSASALAAAGFAGAKTPIFYGLRAFGPNWPYDPSFTPGSLAGFVSDVDHDGFRMNPNKLLVDPYALEISHDPLSAKNGDGSVFRTGGDRRQLDSALLAPKGVVLAEGPQHAKGSPARPLRDDVIYEVHVRGFTMLDPSIPEAERGTYAGAAKKAAYLRALGVTAIELLPLQETPNDQNDRTPDAKGDNYWGYSTFSYFAPDRRYAADRSLGGPTRELRAMVDAFHAEGIKVFVDVVYNHTAEGGAGGANGSEATLYSLRGLDNPAYYELGDDASRYVSSNGVGPNLNTASALGADLVVHSLSYWHDALGVDGFRFDLASVVANHCKRGCYQFDRSDNGILARIAKELPARPNDGGDGADLIAEPWGLAPGSYQVGGFPAGWSEWNDRYRDAIRKSLNRLGVENVPVRELTRRLAGSPDLHGTARPPAASINFVVAHDGMTLADLFRYDAKRNGQAFPFGPSDGGTDSDFAFSHGGDAARQRAVTRTAFALAALSAGVPMFTGGDERLRTQRGNNNAYNLDSIGTWLDWTAEPSADAFSRFASGVLAFRHAHRALRPAASWKNAVRWVRDDGAIADDAYLDAADRHYIGMLLDGASLGDDAAAVFVAFSAWSSAITVTLPSKTPGWRLAGDTSEDAETWGNWRAVGEESPVSSTYVLGRRAVAVFVAK